MTDISNILNKSATVEAIYAYHKKRGDSEPQRGYLGASIIGHECERYLWYCFRQACKSSFDGRMYRLFETGDLEEFRFVKELRAIGCTVHEVDQNGNQWAVEALSGHFSGHMDGAGIGIPEAPKTWHVLEFKTHNAKSFAKLRKEGVKKSKPQHYAQMMAYMHLTGMKRALYLARNKDTDELYSERIRYDKGESEALMARAERVITNSTPPARIANRRDYYLCNFCDAQDVCWGIPNSSLPVSSLSCRQCCHATPEMDGHARWSCRKHGRSLSAAEQDKACGDHLVLPGMIAFAEPSDYGQDDNGCEFITFMDENGNVWNHGGKGVSSRDLMKLPPVVASNGELKKINETFDVSIKSVEDGILHRYTDETSRLIWSGKPDDITEAWKKLYADDLTTLTPITQIDNDFYQAVEAEGDRVAVIHVDPDFKRRAEIREGIK